MANDMTKGNPVKLILSFMLPLLLGNLFQQLYSMADTIIVGRTIGVQALAAVGATGSISFLMIGFVQGITSGFAVITAQRFGAGSEAGVRRSAAASISLSIITAVIMTAVSALAARPLLELMKTPPDIIDMSYDYIIVIFCGISSAVFFNLFSAIVRSLGDSRTPLIFLVLASILNIILDFALILGFGMGVEGAGYATVTAQIFSGILCFIYSMKKYKILRLHKEDWHFDRSFWGMHLAAGLPMAFQFSITAIGSMTIQAALNSLGSTPVAAFTAGSKIDQFATLPLISLGVAIATYAAQNYGAGKINRVRDGVTKAAFLSIAWSIIGGAIVIIFSRPLTSLFIGDGAEEVINLSKQYLMINGCCYIMVGLLFVYRNALQGISRSVLALIAGVCELVMRALVAFVLVGTLGFTAVCIASPTAWLSATVWLMAVYFIVIKKIK
jgi:putative MATE family efflux protein